jgi:hypothetical protein
MVMHHPELNPGRIFISLEHLYALNSVSPTLPMPPYSAQCLRNIRGTRRMVRSDGGTLCWPELFVDHYSFEALVCSKIHLPNASYLAQFGLFPLEI